MHKKQAFSPIYGQMVNGNSRDFKYRCSTYILQTAVIAKIHARRLNHSGFFFQYMLAFKNRLLFPTIAIEFFETGKCIDDIGTLLCAD